MESKIDNYYDMNRRFLSFVGQWLYQKPKEKTSFLILILITVINAMITQVTLTVIKKIFVIFEALLKLHDELSRFIGLSSMYFHCIFQIFTVFPTINCILQMAQFFICENAHCIYQTLPPYMLAIIILVKVLTFYFNKHKVEYELYTYIHIEIYV